MVVRDLAVTEKGSLQSFVGNFFFFFSVLQFYISVVCFGMTRMWACVCMCMCVYEGLWAVWVGRGLHTRRSTRARACAHTRTQDQRQSGSHPCLPLICVPRPACPRCAALHRTTHADTMLTSDSPQLSDRDKPGETPNCATALPLASADASFKNGMNYF